MTIIIILYCKHFCLIYLNKNICIVTFVMVLLFQPFT